MNSLSWMIYIANVIGNVSVVATFAMIFSGIAIGISMIAWAVNHGEYDKPERESAGKVLRVATKVCVVSLILAVFLPCPSTIYAMAASEGGEELLKSPEAAKARQALSAWLDKQIEKPESSK